MPWTRRWAPLVVATLALAGALKSGDIPAEAKSGIGLTPWEGPPGTRVTVEGCCWEPGSQVTLRLGWSPDQGGLKAASYSSRVAELVVGKPAPEGGGEGLIRHELVIDSQGGFRLPEGPAWVGVLAEVHAPPGGPPQGADFEVLSYCVPFVLTEGGVRPPGAGVITGRVLLAPWAEGGAPCCGELYLAWAPVDRPADYRWMGLSLDSADYRIAYLDDGDWYVTVYDRLELLRIVEPQDLVEGSAYVRELGRQVRALGRVVHVSQGQVVGGVDFVLGPAGEGGVDPSPPGGARGSAGGGVSRWLWPGVGSAAALGGLALLGLVRRYRTGK